MTRKNMDPVTIGKIIGFAVALFFMGLIGWKKESEMLVMSAVVAMLVPRMVIWRIWIGTVLLSAYLLARGECGMFYIVAHCSVILLAGSILKM